MTKMKDYKPAEKMYVYDKIPLEEIGAKLNISRRTLFYWKKKYEWDRKRFEAERNQEIFSEELLEFARTLMQKISKDIDNKTPTSQSENSNQKSKQSKPTGQLTPEIIEQIEREVLGLNL